MDTVETTASTGAVEGYVDIYLLPVPERNLEAYRRQAIAFGAVVKEHGALDYREFRGDDLGDGMTVGQGEMLTAAVAEFRSREHRDEVMRAVMSDPRVTTLTDGDQVAEMGQMRYGGFRTFVRA